MSYSLELFFYSVNWEWSLVKIVYVEGISFYVFLLDKKDFSFCFNSKFSSWRIAFCSDKVSMTFLIFESCSKYDPNSSRTFANYCSLSLSFCYKIYWRKFVRFRSFNFFFSKKMMEIAPRVSETEYDAIFFSLTVRFVAFPNFVKSDNSVKRG